VSVSFGGNLVASEYDGCDVHMNVQGHLMTSVAKWRKCGGSCGTCSVASTSKLLRTLKPDRLIEWAHNVLDMAEDLLVDQRGVPGGYRIKCDMGTLPTNFLLTQNFEGYIGSRQHQEDLISNAVETIAMCMRVYNSERTALSESINRALPTLSLVDVDDFKECMKKQVWFSVIHAGVDEINIITSTAH
jgi:hypothetical protein